MADILIKGMDIPQSCVDCLLAANEGYCCVTQKTLCGEWGHVRQEWCPLVEVPTHGRLIDAGELRGAMYHEAFEKDSDMQRWDSGCWIRYKMFEKAIETAPTVIEASEDGEQDGKL